MFGLTPLAMCVALYTDTRCGTVLLLYSSVSLFCAYFTIRTLIRPVMISVLQKHSRKIYSDLFSTESVDADGSKTALRISVKHLVVHLSKCCLLTFCLHYYYILKNSSLDNCCYLKHLSVQDCMLSNSSGTEDCVRGSTFTSCDAV